MTLTAAGTSQPSTRGCDRLLIDSAGPVTVMLAPIAAQTSTVVHAMHSVILSAISRRHPRRSDARARSSSARTWQSWEASPSSSSPVQSVQLSEVQAEV